MKKSLVAIAVLAAAGASFAQSNVTISGNVQMQYYRASDAVGNKGFGIPFANVLFAGTEDLGGGLKASFKSEIGLAAQRGSATVQETVRKRDTALSLAGGFGSLTIQNTRSSSFLVTYGAVGTNSNANNGPYDISANVVSRSAVDNVTYSVPVGPVTVSVLYTEASADGNTTPTLKTSTLMATYVAGPLNVGLRGDSTNGVTAGTTKTSYEVGATYDFGVAKVGIAADTKRRGLASTDKGGVSVGVKAPVGPVTLGLGYMDRGTASINFLTANYAFSKRTSLELNYTSLKGAPRAEYNIVLGHSF